MNSFDEITLEGLCISEGIAIGHPYFLASLESPVPNFSISEEEIEYEIERYRKAIYRSENDLKKLQSRLEIGNTPEIIEILNAHLEILKDPLLTSEMERKLYQECRNVESIFQDTIIELKVRLQNTNDGFFQDRVRDIMDVSRRILRHLRPSMDSKFSHAPFQSIIMAKELVPSDIVEIVDGQVIAFVTQVGGSTSHSGIIARARGIPLVAGIDIQGIFPEKINTIIVDGFKGIIILNPKNETYKKYENLKEGKQGFYKQLQKNANLKPKTKDGVEVHLFGNIETQSDIELLLKHSASGVGLFRSEYLFLVNKQFPSEEDQFNVYRGLVKKLGKKPLVIRIFDIGGDKHPDFYKQYDKELVNELNPVLGCRAIRFLMRNVSLLEHQLRAILRASIYGNIHILVPMVSDLSELLFVQRMIEKVRKELTTQKVVVSKKIPLGCMIEVPSSAIMSRAIAKEVDFLSVGTNDLIQYVLAADRTNPYLSYLYSPAHPSIIRLILMIVEASLEYKKPLLLCGEMGADPKFIPILLGLGIKQFSVSARHIPIVKNAIRNINFSDAEKMAKRALEFSNKEELYEYVLENAFKS